VVVGLLLAVCLVVFGVGTAARQRRTIERLREEKYLPSDDRAYLRGQVRRRLATSVLLVILGGMIGGAFLSGMEDRATEIGEQRQKGANPADDPGRPADPRQPTEEERQFVRFWGGYWIAISILVFVVVCLAIVDFWATRRYWMAQYRLMKEDHQAKLQRDLAVYRQAKDNERLGGRGRRPRGGSDGSSDDTDEQKPLE
jgi:uncharacterized membrane protein YgcG